MDLFYSRLTGHERKGTGETNNINNDVALLQYIIYI